ncbi:MAG: AraC family transcriptional regulator [Cyclobacteriaceae bacterium]
MMRRANDIPAAFINLRINVAESFGANREAILQDCNLDPNRLQDPKSRVSVEQTMEVWQAIAKHTGSEEMGLESGLQIRMQFLGVLGYVMMNSSSILVAYQKLCNYQRLVASIIFQTIKVENDLVRIEGEMKEEWNNSYKYTIDFVQTANFAIIGTTSAKDIFPLCVGFNYPEPKNINRYKDIFRGAKIEFGCEKPYMVYKKGDLEYPMIGTNEDVFRHFQLQLEEIITEHDQVNKFSRQTKSLIREGLKAEIPQIHDVAKELALSVRALQLNLQGEGTTFQSILNTVRKEVSMTQLRNPNYNVTDVAFLTGFSDVSVFSRNFKKWTGITPSQYQLQV